MAQWTSELHNQSDALPTVKQWLTTISREGSQVAKIIKLIWTPNLYTNYSLDTESYRFRVTESHYLFSVIEDNLTDWIENDTVLALQIEGFKAPTMTLLTLDTEQGDWTELGTHGWKIGAISARKKDVTTKTRQKRTPLGQDVDLAPSQGASE